MTSLLLMPRAIAASSRRYTRSIGRFNSIGLKDWTDFLDTNIALKLD